MAMPPRHGLRWSTVPTPLSSGAPANRVTGTLTPLPEEKDPLPVIATRELDAFLQSLPRESTSFLIKSQEVRYDPSLKVGGQIRIGQIKVPQTYTWVFTDIAFYAFGPTPGLGAVPAHLNDGALVGILRLDILINGRDPVNSGSYRMSPYAAVGQVAQATSGWPWLNRSYGGQNMPSFAIYAKETANVDLVATVEAIPLFSITRIGVNIQGFAVPSVEFDKIWLKKA